jgi:hypothetical protein
MQTLSRRRAIAGAITFLSLVAMAPAHAALVSPGDLREIRNLFARQAKAETDHNIAALKEMFAPGYPGEPDPVSFVARAYRFWGKDAVIAHFQKTFDGTWAVEPDETAVRLIPLNGETVQIYAPTRVTIGAPGEAAATSLFLINEFAVRTPSGWKIAAVIPVPAK